MKWIVIFSILLIGLCKADLPTELPDLDDLEAVKERCNKKGGPDTYDKVKKAQEETQKCIKGLVNINTIETEVKEARKTGSMDEVFGRYCGKRPQIRECLKKVHDAIQPCLEQSEKEALNVTANILTQIGDFACYRDGDRIAMFVAEGGIECLNSRAEGIKDCVNQTLKFNPATFSPNSIPNLSVDKKKCDNLNTIQTCVVKDLEDHCTDSTPANIVDALFRFVKRTACKEPKSKRSISLKRAIRSAMIAHRAQIFAETDEKLRATCKKNGGEDAYYKLMKSYNASVDCLKTYRIFVTPSNVYQKGLFNCTAESRKALKDCLTEDEKYYADFLLEELQSMFGFFYSNADKFMRPSEFNIDFANCLKALSKHGVQMEMMECLQRADASANNTIITIPPKSQLCVIMSEVNTCLSNTAKSKCVNDIRIKKFIEGLFGTLETPCKNKAGDNNEA